MEVNKLDALKLRAVLGLDKKEYDEGLKDAEDRAGSSGSKIGSFLTGTAKVVGAGLAAATAATAALVKSSVSAYADYEQLVGGVETLFGAGGQSLEEYAESVGKNVDQVKDEYNSLISAQTAVMDNASNAYKTAGLSANEYMETVTSFAAALNSSLGGNTEEAAKYADMAITDMADNANKMGTSMEMIQNAYQGFAKQNYTMLDNLKLGYGGTKEEMQRLLEDAEALSGVHYDISSYADIVDAIHVVQDEMGITGTTAEEAEKTISGSIAMTKSAWENLITGIANGNADIDGLVSNVIESAKNVVSNLLPVISTALNGVGELIKELAPIIAEELPALMEEILPSLIEAGTELFIGFAEQLPALLQVVWDSLMEAIDAVGESLAEKIPELSAIFENLETVVMALVGAFAAYKAAMMITETIELVKGAITALQVATEGQTVAQTLLNAVMNANPFVLVATLIGGLVVALITLWNTNEGFRDAVIGIWDGIKETFSGAIEFIKNLWSGIGSWFGERWSDIKNAFSGAKEWFSTKFTDFKNAAVNAWSDIKSKFSNIKEKIKSGLNISEALTWGQDLIQNFINGILAKWEALKSTVASVAQSVKDFLGFSEPKLGPLSNFHTYAPDMMNLFMQGIRDNKSALIDTVADAFDFQNLVTAPELDTSIVGTPSGGASGDYDMRNNTTNQTWNVNIYQPMESAVDVARKLREESQYGLLGGGSLA